MKRGLAPRYDIDCYDRHACLKAPFLLSLAIVFACREYLLPIIVLLASMKGQSYAIDFLLQDRHTLALLSEAPALLVGYAFVRRVPSGDLFARWIWKVGRALLATAVLLDIYLAAHDLHLSVRRFHDEDFLTIARVVIDIAILSYLGLSSRVKDVFAEFPERVAPRAR